MFRKVEKHLLIINTVVFVVVLAVFSVAVYFSVVLCLQQEQALRLTTLTDAVIGSFDVPDSAADDEDPQESIPEILRSDKQDFLLKGASLQWFDESGRLVVQKGPLPIVAPFVRGRSFQTQSSPHLLLLTRAVERGKRLNGYVRAGISLAESDAYRSQLLAGLIAGTILAVGAAFVGVCWLVRQSLGPLQTFLDKLTQFTSDASHELRNPLMAVKTNAAVALRHAEGMRPSDKEKLTAIVDATDQMIRTTNDLLTLAQAELSARQEEIRPTNLAGVLSQVSTELSTLAESKSIDVSINVSSDIFLMLREDDLKSLMANLLENGLQYTNPSGFVEISASRQGRTALIEIMDNGIGIASEDLPKIFDRFWRSDKARSHRSGGNGLGLAIVQAVLDRYGGTITVSSRRDEGTTVSIALPCVDSAVPVGTS